MSVGARIRRLRSVVPGAVVLLGLLLLPGRGLAVSHGPEWIPADDPIYADVRALVLEGTLPSWTWSLRPVTRMELARQLLPSVTANEGLRSSARTRVERELAAELTELGAAGLTEVPPAVSIPCGESEIQLRPYAWVDGVWEDGEVDWGPQARVGLRGTAYVSPQLTLHESFFVGDVPHGRAFADALINHTDLLLTVDEAYVGYQASGLRARIGRARQGWGPQIDGSLLLDAGSPSFDHLDVELPLGRLRFRTLTGVLQSSVEKNLAAHRLEWRTNGGWEVGLSERAIFHGSPWRALYLIGIVPTRSSNGCRDRMRRRRPKRPRSATTSSINSTSCIGRRIAGSGRPSCSTMWRRRPPTCPRDSASCSEVRCAGREQELTVGVEAAKVYVYTYSVYYDDSDWTHQNAPLGYPLGPDVESVRLSARWQPSPVWGGEGRIHLTRRGEGRLGQAWYPADDPRASQNSNRPAYQLSGRVESRWGAAASIQYEPSAATRCELGASVDWIENRDHRAHASMPVGVCRQACGCTGRSPARTTG
ncbi:MAG: hypothetical protein R3E12_16665 [Candidatus Eisenbacteria bacterium]